MLVTLRWETSHHLLSHAELVSPSILAVGNTAFIAAIGSRVTQHPQVLIGNIKPEKSVEREKNVSAFAVHRKLGEAVVTLLVLNMDAAH